MAKEFLDPKRKLIDAIADWLLKRVRNDAGVRSLSQIMVVVPTAQSGRNLRLALAMAAQKHGWAGIIPPHVVLPKQLVKPALAKFPEATPLECAAMFQQYVNANREQVLKLDRLILAEEFDDITGRFALFDQLQDIWRALAGRGYLMQDVPQMAQSYLETEFGDEMSRWRQLAELERGYFEYLHRHNLAYPTELVKVARENAAIIAPEIDEIVLPALADPIRVLGDVLAQQEAAGKRVIVLLHAVEADADRFDVWGWPKTERWIGASRPQLDRLADCDIICAADGAHLAQNAANSYPEPNGESALPALALCDEDLFQAISSAFMNRGYTVHNPGRHFLAKSSLGRLIGGLIALYSAKQLPWREFIGVLRCDDVLQALQLTVESRARVLAGIDLAQNAYIPTVIPSGFAFPANSGIKSWQKGDFDAFCETGRALEAKLAECKGEASLSRFLRRMLKWIFSGHLITGQTSDREFLAAVNGAREFLNELESAVVASLVVDDADFSALARRTLDAVVYSLEPDATDAIKTEGWLELAWSFSNRIALVGLHEGKIPDSIIGHPFLPDALRKVLGLVTNEDRLARDTWILKELIDSHADRSIRAYVARANDKGDICRPSRLLYLCSDATLSGRIKKLFADLAEESYDRERKVEWALALPSEISAPAYFSPSAIDSYLNCPFTYLLEQGLNMRPFTEKLELEANDFGTYIHDAMEAYARLQIDRGDDQFTDVHAIRRVMVEEIFPAMRARYHELTLNLELQLRAAEGRLLLAADAQAKWAAEGWRIRMVERKIDAEVPRLGFRVHGYIDRVDENISDSAARRWCLIDYKTWDEKKLTGRVYTTKPLRMRSVQLPVYGLALAESDRRIHWPDMQFRYFILGEDAGNVEVCNPLTDEQVEASIETARRAVELIRKNIFWPPGPKKAWQYRLKGLFVTDPVTDLEGSDWAREQERRLETCNG